MIEVNNQIGQWFVIRKAQSKKTPSGQSKSYWVCQCVCGVERDVSASSLISGKSVSCGCIKKGPRETPGTASMRNVLATYRTKAIRQNLELELTEKLFVTITSKDCFYCGAAPANRLKARNNSGDYIYNGIDRLNNDKGYIKGNMVPCCKNCNLAKRGLTVGDFFNMVKLIYKRHINA